MSFPFSWTKYTYCTLHEKLYFLFPNVPERIALEFYLSCIIRKDEIFSRKSYLVLWNLSQKLHGNFLYIRQRLYIFSVQIWYYSSVKKAKMIFSRKNKLKDDIPGIIEKMTSCSDYIKKFKMIKKFIFKKTSSNSLNFYGDIYAIGVLIYCLAIKQT